MNTQIKSGVETEVGMPLRTYDYEMVCGASSNNVEYPKSYSIPRENTGTLKNQGNYECCVAEVISQIAEEGWRQVLGEQEEFSEGFTYGTLRKDTSVSPGMIVSTAMDLWREIGTLPKKYFDRIAEMPEIKNIVKNYPELYEIASKYKLSGYVALKSKNKDIEIKDALMKYNYGLVAVAPNYFGASHCIQIVGWDDEQNKYEFKNSQGARYRDNGYGYIPKSEITHVYLPLFRDIELPFEDVHKNDWYYKAIMNMYFSGLMNGTSSTTFEPNSQMTRAEVATIMDRLCKIIDNRFALFSKVLNDEGLKKI